MRRKQNYSNHNSLHRAYHLFILPVSVVFFCISVYFFISKGVINRLWLEATYFLMVGIIAFAGIWLIRTYSVILQNRMIRQEMRLRYFIISGQPFNGIENKLSSQQISALRYASDSELLFLIEITLHEKLTSADIKKKIKQWKGDYYQV